jgi:imidazolonepropionase-like amidohydrolase
MKPPALVAAVTLISAVTSSAGTPVVIRGGRIVTVAGPTIERGVVVIAAGKIVAVGADLPVPPGATVIDASGRTVYPGLIDALTTLGLTEISSVPGSVDTTEVGDVNPHAKAWVALQPHSDLIPVARANGVTAALTAPQGGLISGQSALIRLAGTTPDAMAVKAPAALHMIYPSGRAAADPSRTSDEPDLKTLEERLKEKKANQARDQRRLTNLLEDAKAHAAALDEARAGRLPAPRPDLPIEALGPAARGEVPVVFEAEAEEDIRAAVAFAEQRGLRMILSGALDAWRCAALLKEKGIPVLLKVDRLPRRETDPYDASYANAAILEGVGVRFAIVSDDAHNSRNLPYEAAMARAYGLAPAAALRAITLSPAEILGVGERMGSIEVGKDANLVVATGDIMDHRTQVTHVLIDGVPQSLETRHTKLYEEFKKRP